MNHNLNRNIDIKEIALDSIISNLPGHVYWKDQNFAYIGCNEFQAKSAGYSQKEMIGKTDYDMPWKADADILRRVDTQVMATGEIVTYEEPSTLADGKDAIFLSKKIPLRDKQDNIIGILGISLDITAEKEIEKLRIDAAKKEADQLRIEKLVLEEQEAMTRLLSASMAHELRTPLYSIELGAEGINAFLPELLESYQIARDAGLNVPHIRSTHYKTLANIALNTQAETKAAFSMIDMLLVKTNLTSIDKSKFKTCSIAHCVSEALSRYPINIIERENIHWEKSDFKFHGDELLMVHIIFNLIKNALYHLKAAGKGDIHIWCEQDENCNIFHFKDTSQGIDPEILPHIFDRFYTRTHGGTGIGLAFCKLVMQSFGGSITCESVKGEYSDFVLFFPR